MLKLLLLTALLAAAFCCAESFLNRSCFGTSTTVAVEGCRNRGSIVCLVRRGDTARITLRFRPRVAGSGLAAKVSANYGGVYVRLVDPEFDTNACGYIDGSCDLAPGNEITYSYALPIRTTYPKMNSVIRYELTDPATQQSQACIMFRLVIT